jgi:FtsH-binding integral membrane protein
VSSYITSSTSVQKMDETKRKIEDAKNSIQTQVRLARNVRILSLAPALVAAMSTVLTFTPYALASDEIHGTVSSISVVVFIVMFFLSFGFSAEAKSKMREVSKLRDERKYARIDLEKSGGSEWVSVLWSYHAEVAAEIDKYRDGARKYRSIHNRFQVFIIVASSLVTFLTTASASVPILTWGAAVLSFLVASATGITVYFKYRERAVNLQRTADELEREYNSVDIAINEYFRDENNEAETRLRQFAERAESIKNEQRKREQQLEQSPESRSGSRAGSSGR